MPVPRISVDEARGLLSRHEHVVFVDSRNPRAWGSADQQLPGAIRVPADEAEAHLSDIPPGATVIAYCT